jgi:hypothetical protein
LIDWLIDWFGRGGTNTAAVDCGLLVNFDAFNTQNVIRTVIEEEGESNNAIDEKERRESFACGSPDTTENRA